MNGKEHQFFKHDLSDYGQIYAIELSPHTLSQDLILIAMEAEILLGHITIEDRITWDILARFPHETRCCGLSISPDTSVKILPNKVHFAAAGSDFNIRLYKGTLKDDTVCALLSGHSDHINDIKYDPENNFIASASDDHTVKLWDPVGNSCVVSLPLTSPGMSIGWHKEDTSKLLVAEKVGLIRFYNVETQCPIISLDCGKPLASAHWAPSDPQLVASLQLGELLVWDLIKPCVPVSSSLLFTEMGGELKFSPFGELLAVLNRLEGNVKIVHVQTHQIKVSLPVSAPSNISWHQRIPIMCVGDYKTLCFFRIASK